ncbi:hypothetical protein Psta_0123 [Pirellula staleyi DSM 6068]|uniref:Uncharacterized protein n=1 Tax=Pirellula staleyi (strain ATCC 27377 / DSM 6068 / ICPB 4128) TaxID=530564 RepID=D2R0F1_PIRSD|nr:hypothetical protein [Pirellula staleyi]ADB14819.1 hypothetical protein Psta_0123 [Pirellula staleyi DSM 6068]
MLNRRIWQLGIAAATALAFAPKATAEEAGQPVSTKRLARQEGAAGQRQREGSKLESVEGHFEFSGDRISFQTIASQESFRLLENLSLERVSKVLGEDREPQTWIVSGLVTEYRGSNYLLISKAILKTL